MATQMQAVRAGLKKLRAWVEQVGDYHPARPEIDLRDGTYLQPQLRKSSDGGELAGCWRIERREGSSGRLLRTYPV